MRRLVVAIAAWMLLLSAAAEAARLPVYRDPPKYKGRTKAPATQPPPAPTPAAGVVLSSTGEFGSGGPTYIFNGLNALKPMMIAEATANAREAAEQFARDSGASLGGIRQANQGVFVILPRDQAPGVSEGGQLRKTVRVVSTVQYFLD